MSLLNMATGKLCFFNLKMEILIYLDDKIFCPHAVVNFQNLLSMGSLIPNKQSCLCVFFLFLSLLLLFSILLLSTLRIRGDITENRIQSICEIRTEIDSRDHNCFGCFLRSGEHHGQAALFQAGFVLYRLVAAMGYTRLPEAVRHSVGELLMLPFPFYSSVLRDRVLWFPFNHL